MKRPLLLLLVFLSACAANPQQDQAAQEHLRAEPPQGWTPGTATQTSRLRMSEFVHPDLLEGGWREKITFERLVAQPVASPQDAVTLIGDELQAGCPGAQVFKTYSGKENGYLTEVALMTCPRSSVTQLGQITMLKAIAGNDALYTITRAKRVPPFDGAGATNYLPREEIAMWSAYLAAMSVCDPRSGDAHPC